MQISISVEPKARSHIVVTGSTVLISFEPIPAKPAKVPHVRLVLDLVWNKGTAAEKSIPTLDWLWVPPKNRGDGLGVKLVQLTLDYLKTRKIPYLVFDNYEQGFWEAMERRLPKQIRFPKKLRGKIGYLGNSIPADDKLPIVKFGD